MANEPRVSITKSRSGHYTATVAFRGLKEKQGKLADLWKARLAAAQMVQELKARFSEQVSA